MLRYILTWPLTNLPELEVAALPRSALGVVCGVGQGEKLGGKKQAIISKSFFQRKPSIHSGFLSFIKGKIHCLGSPKLKGKL